MQQKKTNQEMIERSQKRFPGMFTYNRFDYKSSLLPVTYTCKIHGDFSQTTYNHERSKGCPKCVVERVTKEITKTTEKFISECLQKFGTKYDYSKAVYKGCFKNVEIVCLEHGSFWQSPNNHLAGYGCRDCCTTGYNSKIKGYLYLMQCENITKIGITNLTPEHRSKDISRSYGSKFEVTNKWLFDDGSIPDTAETIILRYLRDTYEQPSNKFEGSSECFLNVDQEDLLKKIKEELENTP